MAVCPPSLTWMLIKDQNAFLHKRNGQTKRSGAMALSSEPFNLTQKNSFTASGLCNAKAIDITYTAASAEAKAGLVNFSMKVSKNTNKPNKSIAKTPLKKNFRRVAKSITSQTAGQFYRADLTGAALQRWSSLYRFAMVNKGHKLKAKSKGGRKSSQA